MHIGNVVISTDPGYPLRSGASLYTHAIVISTDPLILVSEESDMRWSNFPPENLKAIGMAFPEQFKLAQRRLEK